MKLLQAKKGVIVIATYGNANDKYQVQEGDVWGATQKGKKYHVFACGDVTRYYQAGAIGAFLHGKKADVIYTDPPWTPQIMVEFLKSAGKDVDWINFDNFVYDFCKVLKVSCFAGPIMMALGNKYASHFIQAISNLGAKTLSEVPAVYAQGIQYTFWAGTFGSFKLPDSTPVGMIGNQSDDYAASLVEPGQVFFDPCCGTGTFPLTVLKTVEDVSVCGVELIPRKLANCLATLEGLGYEVDRYQQNVI